MAYKDPDKQREYYRKYREANKAAIAERDRKYREANKAAIAERMREWREANKAAIAEKVREYYEANKVAIADKNRGYYEANKAAIAERGREWREANKVAIAEKYREYYESNKAAIAEKHREWREANKAAIAERMREWQANNPEKLKAYKAARRAAKYKPYYDNMSDDHKQAIDYIYATSGDNHVDHIVPLKHKEVCGLHVPWNLQHLTKKENLRKSNKLLPNCMDIPAAITHPGT
jgi:5-methylcytosine-specific restriction endonuclease McrA